MSPVTLLCLCASHINNVERLNWLGKLLASVSAQDSKNFKLFLGISFETADFRKRFEEQLKVHGNDTIHVFLFSKRHAQFERYNAILNALRKKRYITPDQEPNTYLSFTDDDDLWAPQRMSSFHSGAERLHADKRLPKYIFTTRQFKIYVEMKDFASWDQLPIDEKNFYDEHYPREYCDIVCKFALFVQFFNVASPELLGHPLCDLAFRKWIVTTATIMDDSKQATLLRIKPSRPLYFYRQSDRDSQYSAKKTTPHISKTPKANEIQEGGMHLLLHMQLRNMSFEPVPDDDLLREMMKILCIPRRNCAQFLKQLKALPLWRHIFVDLLGQTGEAS